MKLNVSGFIVFLFFTAGIAFADDVPSSEEGEDAEAARLREIIKYGTDNEISDLIKNLRSEKIDYLDEDLLQLAKKTKNQNITLGIFSFLGERSRTGMEELALAILENRENETPQKINAALDYLSAVKEKAAIRPMTEIITSDDTRFDGTAIRALGKILYSEQATREAANSGVGDAVREDVSGAAETSLPEAGGMAVDALPEAGPAGAADNATQNMTAAVGNEWITEILIDYYNEREPDSDTQQTIISAVGSSGGKAAESFLLEIINNDEASVPLRMSALEAAAKMGSPALLEPTLAAVSSDNPNIRSAAVGALGVFDGDEVDAAILESFRDTYFKTRLAAVRAVKKRNLKEAIPYLRYRAEKDEAAAVREEAVTTLGTLNDAEADKALLALFNNTKISDTLRVLCAETLIKNNADAYAETVIEKLDEAKARKQTVLYKGLLKAISLAKTSKVETITARLFASSDVVEKFYALDMTANNRFTAFKSEVEKLTQEKNSTLSRRAKNTLDKLG
ncbi:MAG: HEAT repeat domain-containing protein [Spirochaetaceae bacterium]|jgi:HEAT repeat protein|nr:HEAT repeat domain-containing protein [Spirochaetaceae bacterium]